MRAAFLLLAASVSGIAAFAEKPVCTGWHDWGFRPVERTDGDPNASCRYYSDVSEPIHGPWLTNPTATGMTITWTTRADCGVTVEATRERLKVRAWDWRTPGEPVGCYDAMDIAPDGRVSTPQQGELK